MTHTVHGEAEQLIIDGWSQVVKHRTQQHVHAAAQLVLC
jgi:hypothetical protein